MPKLKQLNLPTEQILMRQLTISCLMEIYKICLLVCTFLVHYSFEEIYFSNFVVVNFFVCCFNPLRLMVTDNFYFYVRDDSFVLTDKQTLHFFTSLMNPETWHNNNTNTQQMTSTKFSFTATNNSCQKTRGVVFN